MSDLNMTNQLQSEIRGNTAVALCVYVCNNVIRPTYKMTDIRKAYCT